MPAYEYECQSCANRFEQRQKMSDPEVAACPACGCAVKRLISGGAGVIAKGGASASSAPACMAGGGCCGEGMGCGGGMCAQRL